ncbi:MAG: hypothetical protein AAF429_14760 [Pseudomonadota bacterium]
MRLKSEPFASPDDLAEFCQTRASHVAQVTLFGYLKTRMGTKHRVLFEDEVFSPAIQDAAARLFSTCLADILLYSVARLVRDGQLDGKTAKAFTLQVYEQRLNDGLADYPRKEISDAVIKDGVSRIKGRVKIAKWPDLMDIYKTFRPSEVDIVRFAPVSEEFKEQDKIIVGNSVRLKWNDVRAQLVKRLDAPRLAAMIARG